MAQATDFQISLKPNGPGGLWALFRIFQQKMTGLLSLDWEKNSRVISFLHGEPISVRSSAVHDGFGHFLVRNKIIDGSALRTHLQAMKDENVQFSLAEWLVMKKVIEGHQVPELLQGHFRESLFQVLALTHGDLKFEKTDEGGLSQSENIRLTEPFPKLLWEAIKVHFDSGLCRSKISNHLSRSCQVVGDFPLALSPQELRSWNQLKSEPKFLNSIDDLSLKLVTAASELGLVSWGDSPFEARKRELLELQTKFKSMKHFEVLGVAENASAADCKKAYFGHVKSYHPDRVPPDAPKDLKDLAQQVFARINEAHDVLTDPVKRDEYVAQLRIDEAGGIDKIHAMIEAESLIPQAKAALRRRHFQNAFESFQKIAAIIQDDAEILADKAYCEIALAIEKKSDVKPLLSKARTTVENALKMRNNYASGYFYLGFFSKLEGKMSSALQSFEQALQIDPKHPEAGSEARLLRMRNQQK